MKVIQKKAQDDITGADLIEKREKYWRAENLSSDPFVFVYKEYATDMLSLNGSAIKLLLFCWKFSTFNSDDGTKGNIIYNGATFKEACWESGLTISSASIDNGLSVLCKKNFLIRKGKGEYLLNPKYFYKGRLADRYKIILPNNEK